jgi:hypothetical protein
VRPIILFGAALVLATARAGAEEPADAAARARSAASRATTIGEYELAATELERAAALEPRSATAKYELSDAIVLRLGLGQPAKADADAAQVLKLWGATDPALAAKVAFVGGAWASEHDDPAGAERELTQAMPVIDRGPLWLRLVAHATLGRALARHVSDGKAAAEYARVRELGATATPPKGDDELRSYARGLAAVGEAILFAADDGRRAARFVPAPTYAGPATGAEIDRWIASTLTPWEATRRRTIENLEPAYRAVLDMTPVPPPDAVVPAGARVAALWSDAADALLATAAPRTWSAPQRKLFAERVGAAAAALLGKAKAANQWCVSAATKFQFTSAESAACGAWLSKRFPREYPPLDELAIAPTYRSGGTSVLAPLPRP